MNAINRRNFIKSTAAGSLGFTLTGNAMTHWPRQSNTSIGIIGMDTSHSVAFSKYINSNDNGFEVIAAYTTSSQDIPSSINRVDQFTAQLRESGIKIVDSIDQLVEMVDCILLETNDGRLHLKQAESVFKSGKRTFIDKPVAASLTDVVAIYQMAKELDLPIFSSSGTRYMSKAQQVRQGAIGSVKGADTYSPISYEPSHSDLFWYGIHGVELLFTVMKSGCKKVRRTKSAEADITVGQWDHGGIGTFRGILEGKTGYGGQAFGTDDLANLGHLEGYDPLIESILEYFRTGIPPVKPKETLEIYAFMEAAKKSTEQHGNWIELATVLKNAGYVD